jgi:hypothetical protein
VIRCGFDWGRVGQYLQVMVATSSLNGMSSGSKDWIGNGKVFVEGGLA